MRFLCTYANLSIPDVLSGKINWENFYGSTQELNNKNIFCIKYHSLFKHRYLYLSLKENLKIYGSLGVVFIEFDNFIELDSLVKLAADMKLTIIAMYQNTLFHLESLPNRVDGSIFMLRRFLSDFNLCLFNHESVQEVNFKYDEDTYKLTVLNRLEIYNLK